MIKKILSVVLTLGMLLTLVSSLPVAAAGFEYPAIFEDFEAVSGDGVIAGPYGIGKAVKVAGEYTLDITGKDDLFSGNVKVSCYIKADEDATAAIVLSDTYAFDEALTAGEWVYCEEEIAVDGAIGETLKITATSAFAIDNLRVESADIEAVPTADVFTESAVRFTHNFESETDITNSIENSDLTSTLESGGQSGNCVKFANRNFRNDVVFEIKTTAANKVKKYNVFTKVSFYANAGHANTAACPLGFALDTDDKVIFGGDVTAVNDYSATFNTALVRDEWTLYEIYYKRDFADASESAETFYITLTHVNAKNNKQISIDSLTVTDYYVPANMTFEEIVAAADGEVIDGFGAWTAINANVESAASFDAEPTTSSAKITAADNGAAGVGQNLYLENNKKFTFSFYAKGEGASVGKTLNVSVDSTEIACGELTDSWRLFTATYRTEEEGVDVVYPELAITAAGLSANDVFYIDDLSVARDNNYKLAYAENFAYTGDYVEGGEIAVTYDEVYDSDYAALATVARLFQIKGTDAFLVDTVVDQTGAGSASFTLPEGCAGDSFKVEFTSFTSEGMGVTETYAIPGTVDSVVAASNDAVAFTPGANAVASATIDLQNNRTSGDNVKAILVIAIFDAEGALVDWDFAPIDLAAGASDTFTKTVTDVNGDATTAKAFVWDCGDSAAPSIFNTTMRQLAPEF